MEKIANYKFHTIQSCNMCGADKSKFKIIGKRLNQHQGWNPASKAGITISISKCKSCGLIFSDPLPIPESIDDHYRMDPNEYWKEEYFDIRDDYFLQEINWFFQLKGKKEGYKSLDIGAGIGKQMKQLEKFGFETFGFEPSETFRDLAVEKMGVPPDKIKHSTIEEAQYKDDQFDFISFGAVLEHLYDPAESIKKTLKWLKKGGLIHIEVPNSNWLISKMINFSYKARGVDYVTNLSPMHPPFHLYEFTLESFHMNGARLGYKVKDSTYYVCDTYLPGMFNTILKPYMKKTNTGMQLCVWLEKN